jgi:hypothetical protein
VNRFDQVVPVTMLDTQITKLQKALTGYWLTDYPDEWKEADIIEPPTDPMLVPDEFKSIYDRVNHDNRAASDGDDSTASDSDREIAQVGQPVISVAPPPERKRQRQRRRDGIRRISSVNVSPEVVAMEEERRSIRSRPRRAAAPNVGQMHDNTDSSMNLFTDDRDDSGSRSASDTPETE